MRTNQIETLINKLNIFIRKYYLNQATKGILITSCFLLSIFICFAILEYYSQLNIRYRMLLFWIFISATVVLIIKYVLIPFMKFYKIRKGLTHEDAAKIIGEHFSDIDDKLLNVLQLQKMTSQQNSLITASINKKISLISPVKFNLAIDLVSTKKALKWSLIPLSIIIIFFLTGKEYILTESSARIIKYNTFFEPTAPFSYTFKKDLETPQFDDFNLELLIEGDLIPNDIYIVLNENTFQLNKNDINSFEYLFKSVTSDISFQLLGGGFYSDIFTLKAIPRPAILDFKVLLDFPVYTKINNEVLNNIGTFDVPEGTKINWQFKVQNTDEIKLMFNDEILHNENILPLNIFEKTIFKSSPYKIVTTNNFHLSDSIGYTLNVIKDNFPTITVSQMPDSSTNLYFFEGIIEDDYELTKLTFNYRFVGSDSVQTIDISLKKLSKELFFYSHDFKELIKELETSIVCYFEVWDNDAINGLKSTKSELFYLKNQTEKEIKDYNEDVTNSLKSQLINSTELSKDIRKNLDDLNKSLVKKGKLSWKEKDKINDIINKQKKLEKIIRDSEKNSKKLKKNMSPEIKEKQKEIDDLIKNLLDEETKELLSKLKDILDTKQKDELRPLLKELENNNSVLEKDLERNLELLKQLEVEWKLENIINDIEKLTLEQEKLKSSTKEKNSNLDSLIQKQETLKDKLNNLKTDLENLKNQNNVLENPLNIEDSEDLENAEKNMLDSEKSLREKKKSNSKKAQQKVIESLNNLNDKLQLLQKSCSSDASVENIATLRQILENLITLSFNQESLIIEGGNISKNSPEFIKLIQKQKKLESSSKIIEDSLFALSKRVVQIESKINKEIYQIRQNIKKATSKLEARNINTSAEKQQYVMTSTNNLALLLSEMLKQMQKESSMSGTCNKPSNCNNPKNGEGPPSLNILRKLQEGLDGKMKKGQSKKIGSDPGLSASELGKLLREQEGIRAKLEELRNEIRGNSNKKTIDKIIGKIEENELDIINNNITRETFKRQQEIIEELLKSEKAEQEQEEDTKTESVEWSLEFSEKSDSLFLKYKQLKEQQEELIQTTPINLTPFYKKKVNEYFNNLLKNKS